MKKVKILVLSTCFLANNATAAASHGDGQPSAQHRLEHIYLLEFTNIIMETARRYAHIAGQAPDFAIAPLQQFSRCQPLFTTLQRQQDELKTITAADKIDRNVHFEHLLTLSLALAYMNHRQYELGKERDDLQKNFMHHVTSNSEAQQQLDAIDAKIAQLDAKINAIFTADPANMLLIVAIGKHNQLLYQEIVDDYYHHLSKGVTGPQLIMLVQRANQVGLEHAWEKITTNNRKFLHQAWRHTCNQPRWRRWLRPRKFAPLGFYIKHRTLVARVTERLTREEDTALLHLHRDVERYFQQRITPQHYSSSAQSFFGLLAALSAPALFISRDYNRFTLPLMGAAGLLYSGYRTKALYNVRQQLKRGAFSGLNTYELYHNFQRNTSLGRYAFSHLSVTALAMVLRAKARRPAPLKNVDVKLLTAASTASSLSSMFIAEAVQSGDINFLKDRDFMHNLFIVAALDFTIALIAANSNKPYTRQVAQIAAASIALSVAAHIISGKEINWDRIIFDTSYISTYSLFKAKYFYVGGSRWLIKKLGERGVQNIGTMTGVASAMALLNNVLGNVPYSIITRNWIERRPSNHKFPLADTYVDLANIDLEPQLDRLLTATALNTAEQRALIRKWLLPHAPP